MVHDPGPASAARPVSPRAAYLIKCGSLCLAVLALLALSYRYMDLLGDSFWSVATGRYILEHGSSSTAHSKTRATSRSSSIGPRS